MAKATKKDTSYLARFLRKHGIEIHSERYQYQGEKIIEITAYDCAGRRKDKAIMLIKEWIKEKDPQLKDNTYVTFQEGEKNSGRSH